MPIPPGPAVRGALTALEHEPIPITPDGADRSLTPAEAERLVRLGEARPGFCQVGHRQVKLAQYCGVVGLGDRVLEVLPKTQAGAQCRDECRGVLLRLLRLTGRLPQHQDEAVGQDVRRAPLLESFIAAFFAEVARLVRGGLLRQYQPQAEDLPMVRGRIALARQLGALANRPDLVACEFDELTADNPWNRVLKRAIRCTRMWIQGVALGRQWVELMNTLDGVDDERLSAADEDRLVFNRQADRYRPAMQWARWILALLAPSLRAGASEAPALLFAMNRLFEAAVELEARRQLGWRSGVDVEAQDRSRSLALAVDAQGVQPAYVLRPDLVFRREGRVVGIADTKWKLLECDSRRRPMPAEADLYQLHAYASAFRCRELALVYPWHAGLAQAAGTAFRLPTVDGEAPVVSVVCIDVGDDALPLRMGRWPGAALPSLG
jgi:5-methylcytosine-specific restriction enzyme subunit McrC